MDDLISRQAAIDVAVQSIKDWDRMFIQEANCRIRDAINELPSAQPEIVRCKDCKFGNISSMGHLAVCGHEKGLVDPVPDSYCSYAERRTDE